MKYVIVLGDGMAGEPLEILGGKTTLEAAVTPVMDEMSKVSEQGIARMVPEGMAPGSDTANLSVAGYDPRIYYTGRSPLEALSIGVQMANDDVASAPKDQREKRRGVAGEVLMWKVGGAKAAKGGDLDEVIAAAQKAIDNTRSVGIGLTPCTLPAVGHPNFEIKDGTMEVGIGHHGEPGIEVCELETADKMAKRMVDVVVPDYPFVEGDEVVVLVSGLGATPVMELYVLYDEIDRLLTEKGIKTHKAYVGNYFTSLEMMGATLTIMKLDDELKELIDMPAESMGLKQF